MLQKLHPTVYNLESLEDLLRIVSSEVKFQYLVFLKMICKR